MSVDANPKASLDSVHVTALMPLLLSLRGSMEHDYPSACWSSSAAHLFFAGMRMIQRALALNSGLKRLL